MGITGERGGKMNDARFLHTVKAGGGLVLYLPQQPDEQMVHFMWPLHSSFKGFHFTSQTHFLP